MSEPNLWVIDASKAKAMLASAAPNVRIVRHRNISRLNERDKVDSKARLRVAASRERRDIKILLRWITKLIKEIMTSREIKERSSTDIIFITKVKPQREKLMC